MIPGPVRVRVRSMQTMTEHEAEEDDECEICYDSRGNVRCVNAECRHWMCIGCFMRLHRNEAPPACEPCHRCYRPVLQRRYEAVQRLCCASLSGQTGYAVPVSLAQTTLGQLRYMIAVQLALPLGRIGLSHNGAQMVDCDDSTLAALGIQNEDMVKLLLLQLLVNPRQTPTKRVLAL